MKAADNFLTPEEEQSLINAIGIAEKNTSGEIRIHIEKRTNMDPLKRAIAVFNLLKMDATADRNGVLLYVAVESKKFAIIGDQGIHEKVNANFWDSEKDLVLSYFKKGNFSKGLELAVLDVGEKLKHFFPYKSDDINELDDEISKG
ncbi:TPM domain-containing protein [Flavobacteriaceae bacterium]|nr:TPM domain-containing protein [Flavobacteriaceae bacterium]